MKNGVFWVVTQCGSWLESVMHPTEGIQTLQRNALGALQDILVTVTTAFAKPESRNVTRDNVRKEAYNKTKFT
jgi:hypothetical protein